MEQTELLDHETLGKGPPLLLLNGGMMSFGAWEPAARVLAEDFKVILCDFRGQLRSPGAVPEKMEGHAADLDALLDRLQIPAVHVLGTSFGALAGLLLAALYPHRVLSLVAATVTDRFTPEMDAEAERLQEACRHALSGGDRGLVHDLIASYAFSEGYLRQHAQALAERRKVMSFLPDYWFRGLELLLESLKGLDLSDRLPAVRCPVLVIAAEEDRAMPLSFSQSLTDNLPDARLTVIPAAGHALVVERPDVLVTLTRRFCLFGI